MVREEVVGVLDCQSENLDHFNDETIDLLTLFSTQASMALQNAQLYSLERRRAKQLEVINEIARQTTAVLDQAELLEKVCSLIQQAFMIGQVSILLREEDELVLRASRGGLTINTPVGGKLPITSELCGRSLAAGLTIIESHVGSGSSLSRETRSCMGIPLVSFGQTLGMLVMESVEEGRFQESDGESLEAVADICATAIQNAHYVERVKQLAYLDGLTGIFNRRFFELRILEEIDRARRFQAGMAVLMVDIDQFKRLNDEFGHLLGDEVLRQVSSIFSQQLRKIDVVCRYGGEEFCVLFADRTLEDALPHLERMRRDIEQYRMAIRGRGRPREKEDGARLRSANGQRAQPEGALSVTISIGAAERDDTLIKPALVIRAADEALYRAKRAGRNRLMR
jgi:diguanylate cyclase (GGDEF)-like protein